MIERLKNWLAARRAAQEQKRWHDGYDYAAGRLLRAWDAGRATEVADDIRFKVSATPLCRMTEWDIGAEAALDTFGLLMDRAKASAQPGVL